MYRLRRSPAPVQRVCLLSPLLQSIPRHRGLRVFFEPFCAVLTYVECSNGTACILSGPRSEKPVLFCNLATTPPIGAQTPSEVLGHSPSSTPTGYIM